MKYLALLLSLTLFACGSKPTATNNYGADFPQPQYGDRQIASDEAYLGKSYLTFFESKNYIVRLERIRMLAKRLHSLMEEKGHPRARLIQKFQDDLDKQIAYLKKLEDLQNQPGKDLPISWLPQKDTYQYGAKIRALHAVKNSSEVMAQLESYLSATKVMEDGSYDQNFYYDVMRKALSQLGKSLQEIEGDKGQDLLAAKLSYADYLAGVARNHLHKAIESRPLEKKLRATFKELQRVRNAQDAKAILASKEVAEATMILRNSDYSNSSDIEGARDDMDTKIATYFSLEMIKYLYGGLN